MAPRNRRKEAGAARKKEQRATSTSLDYDDKTPSKSGGGCVMGNERHSMYNYCSNVVSHADDVDARKVFMWCVQIFYKPKLSTTTVPATHAQTLELIYFVQHYYWYAGIKLSLCVLRSIFSS